MKKGKTKNYFFPTIGKDNDWFRNYQYRELH